MTGLKKIISVLLSVIMLLCLSVTSFAADEKPGDVITIDGAGYIYSGEADGSGIKIISDFTAGEEYYDDDSGEYEDTTAEGLHCCTITADKAGCYAVLWESENDIVFTACIMRGENDPDDGTFKDSLYLRDDNNRVCGVVFKMSEGEKEYVLLNEAESGEYTVRSEYLGTAESALSASGLVRNYGGDAYYNGEYDAVEMYPYLNVTFSEGQTYKAECHATAKASIDADKITADIDFLGKSFRVDVTLINGSSLVKSVSFPENFTPSCIERHDGTITDVTEPDYMIITLADGTGIKAGNMENVLLPNGRSYTASWGYDQGNENGEIRTEITFSGDIGEMARKEITFRPGSESIKDTLSEIFEIYKNYSAFGFRLIFNMREPTEAYEDVTRADGFYYITSVYGMLINACRYYRIMGTGFIPFTLITVLIFALPVLLIAALIFIIIRIIKRRKRKRA